MTRHSTGVGPLLRHQLQHRGEEVRDALPFVLFEVILLPEDIGQSPVPETVDVPQLALAIEDLLAPLSAKTQRLGERPQQLDDLRNVVVVFAILGARLRVEEVVACDKLKDLRVLLSANMAHQRAAEGRREKTYHGSHAPNICAGSPFRTQYDLRRSVLPRLDIICEVMIDPAGVSQIRNLDADDVERVGILCLALLARGGRRASARLVKRDARHFPR